MDPDPDGYRVGEGYGPELESVHRFRIKEVYDTITWNNVELAQRTGTDSRCKEEDNLMYDEIKGDPDLPCPAVSIPLKSRYSGA